MKILVLEDNLERIKQFRERFRSFHGIDRVDYCDTAQNCIELLKLSEYSLIFLDHDLGGEVFVNHDDKNTGSEVARWIEKNPLKNGQSVIVHSCNPGGAEYMMHLIKNSIHVPFVWVDEIFKKTFKQL